MTPMDSTLSPRHTRNHPGIAGILLILIGLWALSQQFVEVAWLSWLFLPTLGCFFLAWGILSRRAGPIIPGGILLGIGTGILLTQTITPLGDVTAGGIFMLAFAAGWGLITLLTALFTGRTAWWPLIPGGIMAWIGLTILIGGPALALLAGLGRLWPLVLIAIGVYILLKHRS